MLDLPPEGAMLLVSESLDRFRELGIDPDV
jgi:hypothetical protein